MKIRVGLSRGTWGRLLVTTGLAVATTGGFAAGAVSQAGGQPPGSGALLTQPASTTSVSYFLKIDGIAGESTTRGHENEIDLNSFAWGDGKPGLQQAPVASGAGGGAGKVSVNDIHFTMNISKASPKLMVATATGKHIANAVLTVRKAGETQPDFLKITMQDVVVSSFQTGSGNDPGVPVVDQVNLSFGRIMEQYSTQNPDGSLGTAVQGGYDVKANKAQ